MFQAYPLLALSRFSPYFPVFHAYPLLALSRFPSHFPVFHAYPLLALSRFSPYFPVFHAYPLLALSRFSPYFPVFHAYPFLALSRFSPYFPILKRPLVLDYSSSHLPLPFPLHFRPSPYFSSFRQPGQYSLRPAVTSHVPCPYHCKDFFFFSISRIELFSLSLITSFFILIFWMILQLFSKPPLLFLTAFSSTCNPLTNFHNRSLKHFPTLCRISVSLHLMKYIYPKTGYLTFLSLSSLAHFYLTLLLCISSST